MRVPTVVRKNPIQSGMRFTLRDRLNHELSRTGHGPADVLYITCGDHVLDREMTHEEPIISFTAWTIDHVYICRACKVVSAMRDPPKQL